MTFDDPAAPPQGLRGRRATHGSVAHASWAPSRGSSGLLWYM
eukprot:CAMPEP_0174335618 /NCGR_PEP_ID=MMETSP0810-20121108/20930_1 /TAXON_ID=73025 ORGANISM="Eutreptiella gymnastica-like, Strain CCMP1594" /NCGR_SAMPLE_ID=MMETSP0810 /ASSEMBLY_ACC=CAM_ASM_000659 /LENGTH=41 /DNA_ID= /DNA_START= /DNA_END= /DNA_ORIENTATION=